MKGSERNEVCPRCGQKTKRCTCRHVRNQSIMAVTVAILVAIFAWATVAFTRLEQTMQSTEAAGREGLSSDQLLSETAEQAFHRIVCTHPSPEVRAVCPLLRQGIVRFAADRAQTLRRHETVGPHGFTYISGEQLFIGGSQFLTDPSIPDCTRKLVIRHEVQHFMDDQAGKHRGAWLPEILQDEALVHETLRETLENEWRAGMASRTLAKALHCPSMQAYYLDDASWCALFKHQMLADGLHIPRPVLERYPALRNEIAALDCASLSGPY